MPCKIYEYCGVAVQEKCGPGPPLCANGILSGVLSYMSTCYQHSMMAARAKAADAQQRGKLTEAEQQ